MKVIARIQAFFSKERPTKIVFIQRTNLTLLKTDRILNLILFKMVFVQKLRLCSYLLTVEIAMKTHYS